MKRVLGRAAGREHGRHLYGGEPLVFHCNYYNYWLQKTLLLDPSLQMENVMQAAAAQSAGQALRVAGNELALDTVEDRRRLAEDTFAELGFGRLDLSAVGADGGEAIVPISHYGRCLRQVVQTPFTGAQSFFDAGYVAAAAAYIHDLPANSFSAEILACQSLLADQGRIGLARSPAGLHYADVRNEAHVPEAALRTADTPVDEDAILSALATLDLSGNEEGLIPRFGVVLTHHFASFYNRQSFEFLRVMSELGLLEAAELLLRDTGYRCAFHTFGGIMTSAEWDAVVLPHCQSKVDWVHGMVAVINALGWGIWRVQDLDEEHAVVRIYDDYESCGWRDMYGVAERPVSHLASAAVAGMMNLVFAADIHTKPKLDHAFYCRAFESEGLFEASETKSMAMGAPYTEIVAKR